MTPPNRFGVTPLPQLGHIERPRSMSGQGGWAGILGTSAAGGLLAEATVLNDLTPTFTRANPVATDPVTGLQVAHNLCRYSQDMQGANWTKGAATVDGGTNLAPDGSLTATLITATAGVGNHDVYSANITVVQGDQYTHSAYVKQGTALKAMVGDRGDSVWHAVVLDFATGAITNQTNATGTVTNVGGGWYRVTCTYTKVSAVLNANVFVAPVNTDLASPSYTAAGTETVLAWGGQANRGAAATTYVVTTATAADGSNVRRRLPLTIGMRQVQGDLIEGSRQNLLTYSQAFDNAAWAKSNVTAAADSVMAPDGTITGDNLTIDTAAGYTTQAYTYTTSAVYCVSVYLKQNTATWVLIGMRNGANTVRAWVNVATGQVGSSAAGGSATYTAKGMEYIGGGWYRAWVSGSLNINTAGQFDVLAVIADGSATSDTGKIHGAWGAQVELGAFPSSYIPTTTAAVTRSADSLSVALSSLVDSRTNLLVRSQEFQTTWSTTGLSSVGADATTAPDGTTTADALIEDATTGSHRVYQTISFVATTVYTASVYVKASNRTTALILMNDGVGSVYVTIDLTNGNLSGQTISGGSWTSASSSSSSLGNGWYRVTITATAGNTGAGNVQIYSGPASYTGTNLLSAIYAWGAQLSQTAAAIEYIPTAAAAITTGPTGLSYDHGTMLSVWVPYGHQANTGGYAYLWGNPTNDNVGSAFVDSVGGMTVRRGTAASGNGAVKTAPTGLNLASRALSTVAQTWASGDNRLTVNGAQQASGAGTTFPADALTSAYLGSNSGAGNFAFGYVAVLYWPRALSAAEIATLDAAVNRTVILAA